MAEWAATGADRRPPLRCKPTAACGLRRIRCAVATCAMCSIGTCRILASPCQTPSFWSSIRGLLRASLAPWVYSSFITSAGITTSVPASLLLIAGRSSVVSSMAGSMRQVWCRSASRSTTRRPRQRTHRVLDAVVTSIAALPRPYRDQTRRGQRPTAKQVPLVHELGAIARQSSAILVIPREGARWIDALTRLRGEADLCIGSAKSRVAIAALDDLEKKSIVEGLRIKLKILSFAFTLVKHIVRF